MILSVRDFGARGDNIHNDLPAFEAAISALAPPLEPERRPPFGFPSGIGGKLVVPQGIYKLEGNLVIDRSIMIEGETGGSRFPASILHFVHKERRDGTPIPAGIIIESANGVVSAPRGDNTIMSHLAIQSASKDNPAHGIWMRARATLQWCRVKGFGGHGIFADGRPSTNQPELDPEDRKTSNVNTWHIIGGLTENNAGHGLYVDGSNSNAGWCIGLDAQDNDGSGIFDSNYLGNTYIACHTDANREAAYRVGRTGTRPGSNNRTILLGCYSERGQPASIVEHPCLVIGGDHGAGFGPPRPGGSPALRIHDRTHVTGFKVLNETSVDGRPTTIETSLGLPNDGRTAIRIKLDGDSHDLLFQQSGAWLVCGWASHGRPAFAVSGQGADRGVVDPSTGTEIPVPEGSFKMERGYYIGRSSTMKYVGVAARAADLPADTDAQVGDRVYNTQPTPGGFIGWVYTSGGWKGFGRIET